MIIPGPPRPCATVQRYAPGQRWISAAEPELGLGTVLRVDGRNVQVLFARTGVLRHFAAASAPLVRAAFQAGDRVAANGEMLTVQRVEERDGVFHYQGDGRSVPEGALDDVQSISRANDRLVGGPGRRQRALRAAPRGAGATRRGAARPGLWRAVGAHRPDPAPVARGRDRQRAASAARAAGRRGRPGQDHRGLPGDRAPGRHRARRPRAGAGARGAGVPVVRRAAAPLQPRLRDLRRGAGRGHRARGRRPQSVPGRAAGDHRHRVPDLAHGSARGRSCRPAGICWWWTRRTTWRGRRRPSRPPTCWSKRWRAAAPGVLLLTATPEQLGRSGHFARLRLLDPARFHDLAAYQREAEDYGRLSALAADLIDERAPQGPQRALLETLLASEAEDGAVALLARDDAAVARDPAAPPDRPPWHRTRDVPQPARAWWAASRAASRTACIAAARRRRRRGAARALARGIPRRRRRSADRAAAVLRRRPAHRLAGRAAARSPGPEVPPAHALPAQAARDRGGPAPAQRRARWRASTRA